MKLKFSVEVKNFLNKHQINYEIKEGKIYIPGNLDLRSLTTIPDGFNPTVGGWLDLSSLTTIPDGFNPTVGGDLDLRSLTTKDRNKVKINKPENDFNSFIQNFRLKLKLSLKLDVKLSWQNGKYRCIDGIFCEVLKERKNISTVKIRNKIAYIFKKNDIYAHGNTVKQAYLDWLFKTSDRDISQYQGIKPDGIHDLNFWVIAYRTITGACCFGTNNYLENNKEKYKDKMTLQEVLTATEGQYGHTTFKEFFNKQRV